MEGLDPEVPKGKKEQHQPICDSRWSKGKGKVPQEWQVNQDQEQEQQVEAIKALWEVQCQCRKCKTEEH